MTLPVPDTFYATSHVLDNVYKVIYHTHYDESNEFDQQGPQAVYP